MITDHAKTTFCDEFWPLRHDNCWSMVKIGSSSFTQAYWSLRDSWKMVFKIQLFVLPDFLKATWSFSPDRRFSHWKPRSSLLRGSRSPWSICRFLQSSLMNFALGLKEVVFENWTIQTRKNNIDIGKYKDHRGVESVSSSQGINHTSWRRKGRTGD